MDRRKRKQTLKTSPTDKWTNKELMALAAGIQKYGFKDHEKISSLIETKSATSVRMYISHRLDEMRKTKNKLMKESTGKIVKKSWNVTNVEDTKNWRPVRKWLKIAENQMSPTAVRKDYSRIVMLNRFQQFYDEAKETTNPQVLDVKAIYKFLLECMSGKVPSQLPIKESTFVLVLLRTLKEMILKHDFQKEFEFIENFRKPVEFVPAKIKDEFRKNITYEPGTIPVPMHHYQNLVCHRQVVNSFNPLGVPLWLLKKEKHVQEFLQTTRGNDQPSTSSEQNE